MKKYIEQSVRIILYISFFVPLIVLPTSYIFPFIVPKIILLRSLVTLALGGYISLLFINWREYKPKATLINIALLLFLLSFAASTFLGVDPYHSFWDNHERMLGLFTILHYVAYYFVAGAVFKNSKDWQWALRIFLLAASLVMFIAVLQRMVDPMLLLNNGSTRVSSTLGNAIYLGGYGLFLSFAAYLAWVREKNSIWKFAIVLFGALGMLGLFFSDTRGSILGFIVGVVIAVLIYSLLLKSYPRTRYFLWSLLGILILVVGTLYVSRQTNFVKNLPAVGRAVNTSFIDIKTSPRWIAWEIAVESWKQKPIFGWGPNNYFYAFNKNYNPRSLEYGYGETWFDNAHNIILNTLAVQGLFGLLAYLALFAAPVYVLLKLYKEDDKKMNNIHLLAVGTAFLGAHLVQNVTVFENITSYLYFVFWLALINGAISGKEFKEGLIPDKKFNFGLSFSVIATCALVVFVFNVQPARANKKTLVAIREINSNPAQSLEYAKQALGFSSPHIDDIRSDLGRSALAILATENSNFSKEKRTAVFKLIYEELSRNTLLHPLDIRNQMTLSQLAQVGYVLTSDPKYIAAEEMYIVDALNKSPRRQQLVYMLASLYTQINRHQEAEILLNRAIKENPLIHESYIRLLYLYEIVGDKTKAIETVQMAEKNGVVFSEDEKSVIFKVISDKK